MICWTLDRAGLDPSYRLRSEVRQLGRSEYPGSGRFAVVDVSCESEASEEGLPEPAIALMLDLGGRGADLSESLPGPAGFVVSGEPREVTTLSLAPGETWWGADLKEERGRYRFRAFHRGVFSAEIRLQVPGRASVIGALATVAVCERIEVPIREVVRALEDFEGISRGFECHGSYRGVTLLDDEGGGPDAIEEVLALVRSVHGRRRLWAVFAPASSVDPGATSAISGADRVVLVGSSIDAEPWLSMLGRAGVASWRVDDLDEALANLDRNLQPGDVLLTLGAGGVGTIPDAFLRRLRRDRPPE